MRLLHGQRKYCPFGTEKVHYDLKGLNVCIKSLQFECDKIMDTFILNLRGGGGGGGEVVVCVCGLRTPTP